MSPETDSDRTLARVAQTLPDHPLPPALRDKVLGGLPAGRKRTSKPWQRVAAGVLAIVAIAAVCWLSVVVFHPRDPATAALAAMREANTWHMSGWKTQRGERRDWEVWGRRKPFFFYEKLGDHVTFDDGHKRTEVVPQDVTHGTSSIVIISKSDPKGYNEGRAFTNMVRGWRKGSRPKTTTARDYVFETFDYGADFMGTGLFDTAMGLVTHNLTFVDKRTFYTDRLQEWMSLGDKEPHTLVEDEKVELNEEIPVGIVAPRWPASYVVLDTTISHDTSALPKDNMASVDGLSAQLTPLAMDKNGDVLFRARGWFGDTRLNSAAFAQFGAEMPDSEWSTPRGPWPYHDNLGRDYVMTSWPEPSFPTPSGDEFLLFAPAAPIKPNESFPKTMTISLSISAYILRPYLSRDMSWTVPLSSTPSVPNFDPFWAQRDPNWRKDWLASSKQTFPAAADDARSWYWMWQAGPYRTKRSAMLSMIKWEARAVQDSVPISMQANFYRGWLANDYSQIRDYRHARKVLREAIAIGKRHPEIWSYNDDQEEAQLKWLDQKHP